MRLTHIPWRELKYALWLPFYLLAFVLVEHLPQASYWPTQLTLDNAIPFCEWFVLFYCTWYPLLVAVGLYLLLRDAPAFRHYMAFLAVTFFASVVIWFLLPNGQDLRPAVMEHHNLAAWLVEYTYSIDTNTNVFPSVHILGCMAAVAAVWHTPGLRKPAWRWGVTLYAALVMVSTMFVKQHAVIDVLAGLLTGAIAYVFVYVIVGRRRDKRLGIK